MRLDNTLNKIVKDYPELLDKKMSSFVLMIKIKNFKLVISNDGTNEELKIETTEIKIL